MLKFAARVCTLLLVVLLAPSARAAEGPWFTELPKAIAAAKDTKKLIFVDFTGSDWCPPCMMLERKILSQPEFLQYAKDKLVLVKVDFPRRTPLTLEERERNEALASRFGVESFPTLVILNGEGKVLGAQRGYDDGWTVKTLVEALEKLPRS